MNNAELNKDCPCANKDCVRHGDCEACETHHSERGYLPACKRGDPEVIQK